MTFLYGLVFPNRVYGVSSLTRFFFNDMPFLISDRFCWKLTIVVNVLTIFGIFDISGTKY